MFKVFIVEDVINLTVSEYFNNDDTLFRKLSNKYINKVIHGIGLVLAIDEKFLRCECKILQTEGSAHYKINFKVLVFHPSVNDIFNASVILINKNFIKRCFYWIL
ncbi:SHS2 domain found in N terminus of Rpb7p/Rpc25p/MJ0397 family protein [Theileria parva strain Muguga]|uniref:SHS2 domain found in N terminus of Rpb7p/Rpc25p/MJ0397 family protein n=1 Tax=Theileria parva strain Muguga TaxID=333668 RepID=UPI001C62274E|nr:SHS2 domain found in N terminus of Rpb7p/Rpc25p/MJ0397 family protein [Theileria parva strain Muguga]EAN32628.2 SHS2 domain found in N terminus of Rpb7p/Rpc25p/MJ0397 family protein [Theileria parva strain Muguga]